MELITHLSINLFPAAMLLTILVNNIKRADRTAGNRLFHVLTVASIALMAADVLRYGLLGMNRIPIAGQYIFHIIHMLLVLTVPFVWLMYVCRKLEVRNPEPWLELVRYVTSGGAALAAILILITPFTRSIFFISKAGYYKSGRFESLPNVAGILFLIVSMVVLARIYSHEVSKEGRREVAYMLDFGVWAFLGIVVQCFAEKWWTTGPCTALAILVIYINTQNHQITTDGLTGLNNRREFDAQLAKKIELYPEHEWGLLMIDVDDFKRINDQLGHAVGDEALWETADLLRHVFGKDRALLARYGGDEFAIIGNWYDEEGTSEAIGRIQSEVEKFNANHRKSYQLSLSVGYAFWHEAGRRAENLIKEADERMYTEKVRKKKTRG